MTSNNKFAVTDLYVGKQESIELFRYPELSVTLVIIVGIPLFDIGSNIRCIGYTRSSRWELRSRRKRINNFPCYRELCSSFYTLSFIDYEWMRFPISFTSKQWKIVAYCSNEVLVIKLMESISYLFSTFKTTWTLSKDRWVFHTFLPSTSLYIRARWKLKMEYLSPLLPIDQSRYITP